MDTTTANRTKYDGKYLVYERATEKLSFKSKAQDAAKYLTVGMVWGGAVSGKSVDYWLKEIEKQKGKEA